MKKLLCTTGLFFMLFAAFLIGQAPKIEAETYSQPTYDFKYEQVGQGKFNITAKCDHCQFGLILPPDAIDYIECPYCTPFDTTQGYYLDVSYEAVDNYLEVNFVSGAVATGLTVIYCQDPGTPSASYTYYSFYNYPRSERFTLPGTYTFLVEILGNYYDQLVPHTVVIQ